MTIRRIGRCNWGQETRRGITEGNLWASHPRLRSGVFRMTIRRIVVFSEKLERAKRFELSTPTLAISRSNFATIHYNSLTYYNI